MISNLLLSLLRKAFPSTESAKFVSRYFVRFEYVKARIADKGLFWAIARVVDVGWKVAAMIILLPISIVGHLYGLRIVPVITERIGHLASEPDCFIKLKLLGDKSVKGRIFAILAPRPKVANRCLLDYWKDHFKIIENSILCSLLQSISHGPLMKQSSRSYVLGIGGAAIYGRVNASWSNRAPILSIRACHRQRCSRVLRALGIPENAWFVCVHVRESGYAPDDDALHDYRNGQIETYFSAMKAIVKQGGWCIRMGHSRMKTLPAMDGVIDYAHESCRSDEMDVFLAATCRFFLGDTSGLFLVSTVFGVPCALANMIPVTSRGFAGHDLCILKLLKENHTGRILSFQEMFDSPVARLRTSYSYEECGLVPIDNSSDEIFELVQEMLTRLDGAYKETSKDIVRSNLLNGMLRPDDYCYGSSCNVAHSFLSRYSHLLPENLD